MEQMRNLISAQEYAWGQVKPYIQDILHKLRQEFTCDEQWVDPSPGHLAARTLHSAPLPPDAGSTHGYGRRTGAAIWIDTTTDVVLGENTWRISTYFPTHRGGRTGIVKLTSTMSVQFDISSGTPERFDLPDGDNRDGFLCWANEYLLPDSTSCFQLQTSVGRLWLRPSEPKLDSIRRRPTLGQILCEEPKSLRLNAHRVVHLVESSFALQDPPPGSSRGGRWQGLTTRDESGRKWWIAEDSLLFEARCRLQVVGRYNDRLRARPQLKLAPPYEAVWEPTISSQADTTVVLVSFQLS